MKNFTFKKRTTSGNRNDVDLYIGNILIASYYKDFSTSKYLVVSHSPWIKVSLHFFDTEEAAKIEALSIGERFLDFLNKNLPGAKLPGTPKEPSLIEKTSWVEFRDLGLLFFVNTILQFIGWSIVFEYEKDKLVKVYPARSKFRGFSETAMEEGYNKFENFLKSWVNDLKSHKSK